MKKKLAAAILVITASAGIAISARAQGRIFFNNYSYATYAPITYGPGTGHAGGVDDTFTAGLWYFLGTATLPDGTGYDTMPAGWELGSVTMPINSGATAGPAGAGFFSGYITTISDYITGPITFSIIAYNGTAYGSVTTTLMGHSAGFTLSSIATGIYPTGEFGPGFRSFEVLNSQTLSTIPEPSIFALSALGAAALMVIRRKR